MAEGLFVPGCPYSAEPHHSANLTAVKARRWVTLDWLGRQYRHTDIRHDNSDHESPETLGVCGEAGGQEFSYSRGFASIRGCLRLARKEAGSMDRTGQLDPRIALVALVFALVGCWVGVVVRRIMG
ncbi:MAG: hypothetical protein AB1898_21270 [Acidobacteriota bacterium]